MLRIEILAIEAIEAAIRLARRSENKIGPVGSRPFQAFSRLVFKFSFRQGLGLAVSETLVCREDVVVVFDWA